MQIDKSPFFRKALVPWYDTNSACLVKSAAMVVVALFGADGLHVAGKIDAYHHYTWVPVVLLMLSLAVLVINVGRLVQRHIRNTRM